MQRIEVALFDFGGVLAEEGFVEGLHAIARLNGLEENVFLTTAHGLIRETGYLTGQSDEKTYWKALREKTGITQDDKTLRKEILSRFILRDWMFEVIFDLKKHVFAVGILSDQTNWLDELNEKYNFFRYFDYVFNSYHAGKSKEDSTHFDDVLTCLGKEPETVLFVDDSEEHCKRAGSRGIHVIHYTGRPGFFKELGRYYPFLAADR
jgi:FMN phosphatase YigB (HAD superfamily)